MWPTATIAANLTKEAIVLATYLEDERSVLQLGAKRRLTHQGALYKGRREGGTFGMAGNDRTRGPVGQLDQCAPHTHPIDLHHNMSGLRKGMVGGR